ncbi:unnamed protein product [Ixodes pacificus]
MSGSKKGEEFLFLQWKNHTFIENTNLQTLRLVTKISTAQAWVQKFYTGNITNHASCNLLTMLQTRVRKESSFLCALVVLQFIQASMHARRQHSLFFFFVSGASKHFPDTLCIRRAMNRLALEALFSFFIFLSFHTLLALSFRRAKARKASS